MERVSRVIGNKPRGRQTHVKVGMLDDTLEEFKSEMGQRVAGWWIKTNEPRIKSLERQVLMLTWANIPWYKKMIVRIARSRLGLWFTRKFGPKEDPSVEIEGPPDTPQPEKAPETTDSAPETPAEVKPRRTCAQCGKLFVVHDQSRICPICVLADR